MKKVWIILGAVVLAVIIAAGSFYGGMAYQRNRVSQIQASFFANRGGTPGQGGSQGFNPNNAQRRAFGGGITGQVKSIEGDVLTISTPQNVTTVNLTGTTRVEKASQGSASDIQTGDQVMVTGQRDTNGNITAATILILGNAPAVPTATP